MKKTDLSSLDGHFREIQDNIQSLLDHIDENSIPSRDKLVQSLYIKQLEGTTVSEVLSRISLPTSDLNPKKTPNKTNYENILSIIETLEQNPNLKSESIEKILTMIEGISSGDKAVIKTTFLGLDDENLKNAIMDVISAFISKEE